jgi:hypothetical protein
MTLHIIFVFGLYGGINNRTWALMIWVGLPCDHDQIKLVFLYKYDETLPNFIIRKHPRKGEKKKQGARTKV